MAKLFWLKTIQPCKLELRPLTDYAGQPLIFTTPGTGFSRRCVTEEVRNSAAVQTYITRQMIADENPTSTASIPTFVAIAPPPPPSAPAAVFTPTVPALDPIEPAVDTLAETIIPEESPTESSGPSETENPNETRRGKRNRGRY